MIVERNRRDEDISADLDIFSLAGRAALVGGGAYAISKTIDENKNYKDFFFNQRKSQSQKIMTDFVEKSAMSIPERRRTNTFKKSEYFSSLPEEMLGAAGDKIKDGLFSDIVPRLSHGGFNGHSSALKDEIQMLMEKMRSVNGAAPTLSYRLHNGELTHIQLKTAEGKNYIINPMTSRGTQIAGKSNTEYLVKSIYRNVNGKEQFYGADVGFVRALRENYEKYDSGEASINDLYDAYKEARVYNQATDSAAVYDEYINPDIVKQMQTTGIEDPGLRVSNQQMPLAVKKEFMVRKEIEGRTSGSASDFFKGSIAIGTESVYDSTPFLKEAITAKSVIKNTMHIDENGVSGFRANKNTLFLDEKDMDVFRKVAADRGIHIGELAPEELLINQKNAGRIIDRSRSLQISTEAVGEHAEFLLDRARQITGLTKEQFSEMIAANGISGFSKEHQEAIRKLSLDDYGKHLEDRKALIQAEKDKVAMYLENPNLSPDVATGFQERLPKLDEQMAEIEEKIRNSNVFGKKPDMMEELILKKNHEGLNIQNIIFKDNRLSFKLREEKILGVGDKIFDASGEVKAIIKGQLPVSELLSESYKIKHGVDQVPEHIQKIFDTVHHVSTSAALKNRLDARSAHSVYYSTIEQAKRVGDKQVLDVIEKFKNKVNSKNLDEQKEVFVALNQVAQSRGHKNLLALSQEDIGFGTLKSHKVGFGNTARYMGAGGKASFSERPLRNFMSMGLNNFVDELAKNRTNSDSVRAAVEFTATDKLLKDKSYVGNPKLNNGILNVKDIDDNQLRGLFPNLDEVGGAAVLEKRRKTLADLKIKGPAIVDLGEEIAGVRKIPIFAGDHYSGFIGQQIGSYGEFKKYSKLDELTKKIIQEMRKPVRDKSKLEILIKDHQTAMEVMQDSLVKNTFKGQIANSLYAQVGSAPEGLDRYAEHLAKTLGTEEALPFVGALHDKDFIRLYGHEEYKRVMSDDKAISNAWGVMTREPTEGYQHLPMNYVPASKFKGLPVEEGRIHVINSEDSKGFSVMKSLMGDMDGDSIALLAAREKMSIEEIKELAYGNSERAKAFRQMQQDKAQISLKSRANQDFLSTSAAEIRESVARAKQLEKREVGTISNALSEIHNANYLHSAVQDVNEFKKFGNTTNLLHFIAENAIKGKHQTIEELRNQKALNVIDAITGSAAFAKASRDERKGAIKQFLEDIVSEQDRSTKGNWYSRIGSDENIENVLRLQELSKTNEKVAIKGLGIIAEESNEILKAKQARIAMREQAEAWTRGISELGEKAGKNIFKYAIAPAAFIGLMGTVFGGSSKVTSGKDQYSDGRNGHLKSSPSGASPGFNPQMDAPRYTETSIRGSSNNRKFNQNYARQMPGSSQVQIQDDRRNFDKYEIRDMVEKGY